MSVLFGSCANFARAVDYTVTDSVSFYNAIASINAAPTSTDRIILSSSITLTQQVASIQTTGSLIIDGHGYTIDGNGTFRPFFIATGNVAIENLTVTNALAQGGAGASGSGGGGGGLGGGGALFVNTGANVTLQNVSFTNDTATGGAGGVGGTSNGGGGGGGLGGSGGNGSNGGGGGGGFLGTGGSGANGGGAGGGILGSGGHGGNGGAGGGGLISGSDGGNSGGSGSSGASGGSSGTLSNTSAPAGDGGTGQSPLLGGGGGGGLGGTNISTGSAGNGGAGGDGGVGGGGGGGGSGGTAVGSPSLNGAGGSGGNGGIYGGGGGAGLGSGMSASSHGGQGGDFGGGGGGSTVGSGGTSLGGAGGFGGGGGGSGNTGSGTGGAAGFGAGAGGDRSTAGSGGDGYGGAVFVRQGGTLTILAATTSGNIVAAGASGGSGGNAGQAAGQDLYLMSGVTANIGGSGNTTFNGSISGDGGVNLPGTGNVTFNGANDYTGSTTISGGTLTVNGTISGAVTVDSGATLMGVGTVGDTTINSGGTIYPGIVGAPLTVNGNFTQNSGTTYSAEVSPTASDKIIVNGHATIQSGSTFNVVLDPGTYTAGTHYVVLTASGGITGMYTNTIMPAPGSNLFFELEYDPFDIQLIIEDPPVANFAAVAHTFNQYQVATALDTISTTATGDLSMYITQLESLTPAQQRAAFDQLSGDIFPSLSGLEVQTTSTWVQLIANRVANQFQLAMLQEQRGSGFVVNEAESSISEDQVYTVAYQQPIGGSYGGQPMIRFRRATGPRWTGWMQGYGLGGSVVSNGNAGALGYGIGGSVFGIDRWVGRNTMVGVFGGYAGSQAGDASVMSNTAINGYQVGAYGLHRFQRCYLLGATGYSGDNYTTNRSITALAPPLSAHSSSAGNQFVKYAELGTVYRMGHTTIQPLAAIQYIYLDQQSFTETGAGVFNLSVGHQTTNSIRPMLGARVFNDFVWNGLRFVPMAQGRWQRECGDGTHLVTSSFAGAPAVAFNTAGNTLGRDFGLFTLGSTMILNPRTSLYGGYDLQVASRYTANMGSAGLQVRW